VSRQTLHAWLARVWGRGAGGSVASAGELSASDAGSSRYCAVGAAVVLRTGQTPGRAGALTVGGFPLADGTSVKALTTL